MALTILAFFYGFFSIFYIISIMLYGFNIKYYMDNMHKFSPILARNGKSKLYNIGMMSLAAIVAGLGCFGLLSCYWWIFILVIAVSANEMYRGTGYYMTLGKETGDFFEAIKHITIHGFVLGYVLAYIFFIIFGGGPDVWLLSLIEKFLL